MSTLCLAYLLAIAASSIPRWHFARGLNRVGTDCNPDALLDFGSTPRRIEREVDIDAAL